MSDTLPVLRSPQAAGAVRHQPTGPSDALVQKAQMLAAATGALPKEYANKPGACLMVLDWADRNDVSIFEAVAEVSMVYGKPVVSAKMQKRLAARAGYQVQTISADEQSATVAIIGPDGNERGRYTYTIELAQGLGIASGKNWDNDRPWMLTKRATTRGLELYGPGELTSIFADDEEPEAETVDLLDPVGDPPGAAGAAPTASEPAASGSAEELTLDMLLTRLDERGIKAATALKAMREMYPETKAIGDLIGDTEALMDLADWIDQQ